MTSAPSKAGAALTGPGGRPIEPTDLAVAAVELDEAQLAAARRLAWRHGRVLERDGLTVLGLGVAARLELPAGLEAPGAAAQAEDLLAAVRPAPPTPGASAAAGPVALALGALPFDGGAPGHLTIPAVAVRRTAGGGPSGGVALVAAPAGRAGPLAERLARTSPGGSFEGALLEAAGLADLARVADRSAGGDGTGEAGDEPPDRFELSSRRSHGAFRRLVAEAVAAIEASAGGLEKVVLAREVEVVANRPFRQDDLLGRLRALHPSCAAFALGGFVGASPELLCRREGRAVASMSLAGTIARSGDPEEDARLASALLASDKERAEHALVVRAILGALEPHCSSLTASEAPVVLELRNVAHLATSIAGELAEGRALRTPGALELAAALHPTPAVGGWPRDAALAYLARHEALDRDRYAGPLGYLDGRGDGEWWVGIRSALVEGNRARLLAGVGIVADSDPDSELAETQLKLQALLAVAVRP